MAMSLFDPMSVREEQSADPTKLRQQRCVANVVSTSELLKNMSDKARKVAVRAKLRNMRGLRQVGDATERAEEEPGTWSSNGVALGKM